MLALFKPEVVVDGYEMPSTAWGRTTVAPARPGRHHVHVHVTYWLQPRIGPADTVVDVYPGRLTELEYKAPVWGYGQDSLGSPRKVTTASASASPCSRSYFFRGRVPHDHDACR